MIVWMSMTMMKMILIYRKQSSNMPVYEILLLENLPKSAALPVGLVQAVKAKFVSKQLDFDFIYYTESDQVSLLTFNATAMAYRNFISSLIIYDKIIFRFY